MRRSAFRRSRLPARATAPQRRQLLVCASLRRCSRYQLLKVGCITVSSFESLPRPSTVASGEFQRHRSAGRCARRLGVAQSPAHTTATACRPSSTSRSSGLSLIAAHSLQPPARPPWWPNSRQGSGCDSPWRHGGVTTSSEGSRRRRAPHRLDGGKGCGTQPTSPLRAHPLPREHHITNRGIALRGANRALVARRW